MLGRGLDLYPPAGGLCLPGLSVGRLFPQVHWLELRLSLGEQPAFATLEMALAEQQVAPVLIHHSDRGRQYCSFVHVNRLRSVGIQISMSIAGHPMENARGESFFKTVKCEETQAHLQTFLEDIYNAKSLEHLPPDEFEAQYLMC